MNTEQLKTFLCLAKTRNFSKTAGQLFISQSTVSKRIQELEKETNQTLFIRSYSGVKLTSPGLTFLEYAKEILNIKNKAMDMMGRTSQYKHYLVIGASYAYSRLYMPNILSDFLKKNADISMNVKVAHTGVLVNLLRQSVIDIAYLHHHYIHPEYVCRHILSDKLILVTGKYNEKLCSGITYDNIKELPIIHSNFLYNSTKNWLFPKNFQFQLQSDLAYDTLPIIKGSEWCAIFPQKMIEDELLNNMLYEIPITDYSLPLVNYYIAYKKQKERLPAVSAWLKYHHIHQNIYDS